MENTPRVAVGPPDDLGLRKVTINGKPAGKVRSQKELQRLLRRAGLAFGYDIQWLGGDSTVWPDRPWQRRMTGGFMAAGLLVTAYFLIKIGAVDIFNALTFPGRIAGATFLFASAVEIIAAAATVAYWRKQQVEHAGAVILLGVVIAFIFGLTLLFMQISGRRGFAPYMLIWIALTAWSSWALWIMASHQAWKGINLSRRIAIGAMVPLLFAVANVAYSQLYIPYATSPLLQSGAEFRMPSLNREGTEMYQPVHLHLKNSGQIPVYVLGSIYWIHGMSRDSREGTLISSGEFITPPGRVLNPGEEFSADEIVEIDPDTFKHEALMVQTEVYVTRKDRMRLTVDYASSRKWTEQLNTKREHEEPQGPPKVEYYRYQADISSSAEILNVARGRRRVTLWWALNGSRPYIYADVTPPGDRKAFNRTDPDSNREIIDRYGLIDVKGSVAQEPFVELLEKAQAAAHSAH